MKQAHALLLTAAIGFGAAASGWWVGQRRTPELAIPASAATGAQALLNLKLPLADGPIQSFDAWRGKWLVVNFWATWCPPCRQEMPLLEATQKRWSTRGVQVVGLGIDEAAAISRYRADNKLSFPLLVAGIDAIGISGQLGNTAQGLPFTVILDPQGKVRHVKSGPFHDTELDQLLETLQANVTSVTPG